MGPMHRQEGLCVRPQSTLSYAAIGAGVMLSLQKEMQPGGQSLNLRETPSGCQAPHSWAVPEQKISWRQLLSSLVENTVVLFRFTSSMEMRFSYCHLIPSGCLTLSELMHTWNQTEIISSPFLASKWPFSGRQLLGLSSLWNEWLMSIPVQPLNALPYILTTHPDLLVVFYAWLDQLTNPLSHAFGPL